MDQKSICTVLGKKLPMEEYLQKVYEDESWLPLLLDTMETEPSAVKYQAEKVIRAVSQERPALLGSYFPRLAALLDSNNSFIRWGCILTIANLLAVVDKDAWRSVRGRYLSFLRDEAVAAFGNAVAGIPQILARYPEEEESIVPLLLAIDGHTFYHKGQASPSCRDVAKGHIIDCFQMIFPASPYGEEMMAFARAQIDNPRPAVRRKARAFLKKYES